MRIFVALDIDSEIRQRISAFADNVRHWAPGAKWVSPETFHITLKFIGEKSPDAVERIKHELLAVRATPFQVRFAGHGFFPGPKTPKVFWAGIHSTSELPNLAASVDQATARTGVPPEEHAFTPHLTLARARGGSGAPHQRTGRGRSGNPFVALAAELSGLPEPDFGTMTATEFFLYESKLLPKGAQYSKLERFSFGGHAEKPAINE